MKFSTFIRLWMLIDSVLVTVGETLLLFAASTHWRVVGGLLLTLGLMRLADDIAYLAEYETVSEIEELLKKLEKEPPRTDFM